MKLTSHAIKIGLNLGKFFACFPWAETFIQPFNRVALAFGIIAPAHIQSVALTQRHNVPRYGSGIIQSRIRQCNPVILHDAMPQANWPSANCAASLPVAKATFPVKQFPIVGKRKLARSSTCLRHLLRHSSFCQCRVPTFLKNCRVQAASLVGSLASESIDVFPVITSPFIACRQRLLSMFYSPIMNAGNGFRHVFWMCIVVLLHVFAIALQANRIHTGFVFRRLNQVIKRHNLPAFAATSRLWRKRFWFWVAQLSACPTRTGAHTSFGAVNTELDNRQIFPAASTTFFWEWGVDHHRTPYWPYQRGSGKAVRLAPSAGHDSCLSQLLSNYTTGMAVAT